VDCEERADPAQRRLVAEPAHVDPRHAVVAQPGERLDVVDLALFDAVRVVADQPDLRRGRVGRDRECAGPCADRRMRFAERHRGILSRDRRPSPGILAGRRIPHATR
jgi:hypothetical protein